MVAHLESIRKLNMQIVHQSRSVVPRDRLIRLPDVEAATGLKRSAIYNLMSKGSFPRPVRLSTRYVAWPETAVLQWVQDRIASAQSSGEGSLV